MKKFISLFLVGAFLSLNSWSATTLPGNKPEKKRSIIDQTNSKQDLICADYVITCGSGFVCANSLQEISILVTLIYLWYCVYEENPTCDPPTSLT
ncbi:MAG: hypothetical protein IT214_12375 [Chitinophagaceae bacterium]|nr:hypothetical protein [Chitinophagaceae bacterium]